MFLWRCRSGRENRGPLYVSTSAGYYHKSREQPRAVETSRDSLQRAEPPSVGRLFDHLRHLRSLRSVAKQRSGRSWCLDYSKTSTTSESVRATKLARWSANRRGPDLTPVWIPPGINYPQSLSDKGLLTFHREFPSRDHIATNGWWQILSFFFIIEEAMWILINSKKRFVLFVRKACA